jgi:hypothetical protein
MLELQIKTWPRTTVLLKGATPISSTSIFDQRSKDRRRKNLKNAQI